MGAALIGVGGALVLAIIGATWKLSAVIASNTAKVGTLSTTLAELRGTMTDVLTRLGRVEGRQVRTGATVAQSAEVLRDVVAPQVREVHEALTPNGDT